MEALPLWAWMIVGPIVIAVLTQIAKYLAELGGADWKAEATQIVAGGISLILTLAAQYVPGLSALLAGVLNQPVVTQVLIAGVTTALSYVAHDVASALNYLYRYIQSLVPTPAPSPVGPQPQKQT